MGAGMASGASRVAVIGAGSWGTAVSWVLSGKGLEVRMWCHSAEVARGIADEGHNPRYLTDIALTGITASTELDEVLEGADAVVFVTPSTSVREISSACRPLISPSTPLVMLSKGVEADTGLLLTEILEEELGGRDRIAGLSGPNHAEEVSRGIPSATVVASDDEGCALFFQELFNTYAFRVYTSGDVTGVELCAACKNIIAIANGVAMGYGYGDNTSAMIMTRGLAEMSRLAQAKGGDPLTCMGLAGMGDLIATCTSRHSRNRLLGEMISEGKTLDDFIARTHMVAEGATASKTVTALAERLGVDMPIAKVARRLVWEGCTVEEGVDALLSRTPKPELHGISHAAAGPSGTPKD